MIEAPREFLYAHPPETMQKPLVLSLAVCLGLAGCQIFEKSETWETVMRVRPGDTIHEPDDSAAYAEKLHRVLLEQGVEHIVVTYQFHYYTNHYEEAVTTRTAVIYRDDVNPHYPWWLKDDRIATPFWLPNGDLNHQVSFYALRPAEVIEKQVYPAHGRSGKSVVTLDHPPQAHLHAENNKKPQPVTRVAPVKAAPVFPATSVVSAHPAATKPVTDATRSTAVTKIQRPAPAVAVRSQLPAPSASANLSSSSWAPPAAIDPVAQGSDDEHLERLFHARNGTKYDPTSAVDRRKMEQIKRRSVERDTTGARGFHHGVDGDETRLH